MPFIQQNLICEQPKVMWRLGAYARVKRRKINKITTKESDKKGSFSWDRLPFPASRIEELFRKMVSGDQVERWLGLSSEQDRHKVCSMIFCRSAFIPANARGGDSTLALYTNTRALNLIWAATDSDFNQTYLYVHKLLWWVVCSEFGWIHQL